MNEEKIAKEPCEKIYRSRGQMIINNFLGGMAWSFGSIIGAAIILTIIGFSLSRVDLIPVVGSWISQIMHEVALKNPNLLPK